VQNSNPTLAGKEEPAPKNGKRPPTRVGMDAAGFKRSVVEHLLFTCAKDASDASTYDMYKALAHSVRDRLVHRWLVTQRTYDTQDVKRAYYLSSEFLTGRSLGLCLMNMGLYEAAGALAAESGFNLEDILEAEGDPGLGNGGLGRLAACFMDSLATLELPAMGYGIRYDFGIFEQRIEAGQQIEFHDNWLQNGNPWELPRYEDAQTVKFFGRTEMRQDSDGRLRVDWVDARTVVGVPHDSFIVGHRTDTVNTLRLWAARATRDFDLKFFNEGDYRRAVEEKIDSENISKVLYPNDQTEEGKALRLRQQYFFVACSIADIVKRYKKRHQSFGLFPKRTAIQLNDTHPSITVAELMRVLVDLEGLDWDYAWDIAVATLGYTNHTLLPEALERWPMPLFERILPRHLQIIFEINQRFLRKVQTRWPNDPERMERMSIIEEGPVKQVRMANLATVGAHSVNGVARLHTDLVKQELLSDFYELFPERFNNKTNGVTPRRWMLHANPRLSNLISSRIGWDWINSDLSQLKQLRPLENDVPFLQALWDVKEANKRDLALIIARRTGVQVPTEAMFAAHIKRIHEYKRQVLACLQIVSHYLALKNNPELETTPRVYIFAGKAAAGYTMAKLHIRLINDVAAVINSDPEVQDKLAVVFIPNYGVSLAQSIIPAANVSIQISTAGKEASGTSNMKFAMNGALTLGTLDGANVEIREDVGPENFFLFGLHTEQVSEMVRKGYHPAPFIEASPRLAEALSLIESGFFSLGEPNRFRDVINNLRHHDPFLVCADFEAYVAAEAAAAELYGNPLEWSRKALLNIAGSSRFSSDETIRQYAQDIWNLKPVRVDTSSLVSTD
jgi:glycogen phosphorylase